MTRFHIVASLAALLAAAALVLGHSLLLVGVALAFVITMGLGVALPQLQFFGPFICTGNRSKRQVALTFDDGPDARSTPALLDVLREAQIEVTFFAIGQRVAAEPQLANRILREGHLLENHSYAHSYATNFFPTAKLTADLSRAQQVITKLTGTTPKFFRPPVGLSNPNVFRVARNLRLRVIGWSIRSLDTQSTEATRIVARIERGLQPGAIILLHDGNIPAARLVLTVQLLLTKLKEHGYEVVRLDRLLE